MPARDRRPQTSGFTLVELVTVIVLISAIAGVTAFLIAKPFEGATDMSRRAELTDEAHLALNLMAQDIRTALPNSVRTKTDGDFEGVEVVTTRTGGRYRRLPAPGGGGEPLRRNETTDTFDAIGGLPDITEVDKNTGSAGVDCAQGNGYCVNVFNTGDDQFDVYKGVNIAKITNATSDKISYNNDGKNDPAFDAHSPNQRFFVIDDVVSFVCNTTTEELRHRATYGLKEEQPVKSSKFSDFSEGTSRLMARDVQDCSFTYDDTAPSTRSGLVTLDITIARDGETVRLLKQVHVLNAP
jgi:MSHA biogenesis protein MshO